MNHVFKRAVDWKPQPLPELVRSLNDVVRIHFIDLKLDARFMGPATFNYSDVTIVIQYHSNVGFQKSSSRRNHCIKSVE
jgi:hypothetical protein